ncbi:MAG: peptidoglycan binding protein CsiV [Gammaproteobacteria bacterium]|nr:peptidoglycan binding protein CsiV [Gammaproteobacteria bacterium]
MNPGKLAGMKIRFFPVYLTALLLLFCSAQAQEENAEDARWYDVELIVFRHLNYRKNNTETWQSGERVPDFTAAFDREEPPEESGDDEEAEPDTVVTAAAADVEDDTTVTPVRPDPFTPLDTEDFRLTGTAAALQRSSRYEMVLHTGWMQPGQARDTGTPVRIYVAEEGVEIQGEQNFPVLDEIPEALIPDGDFFPESMFDPYKIDLKRPLDGTVKLAVSRYLHLYLDLIYLPPEEQRAQVSAVEESNQLNEEFRQTILEALASSEITLEEAEILMLEPQSPEFYGYRLQQNRRLRNEEIHYFDHPVYGVVAIVKPREFPEPEETESLAIQQ